MLKFRNLDVTPDDPVELWGVEGILTVLERGGLAHIRRVARAALGDPWSEVAEDLAEAIQLTSSPAAAQLAELLERARGGPAAEVAHRISTCIAVSGLTLRQYARRVGTSASRLSTYATGKVTPSAAMLIAIERVAAEEHKRRSAPLLDDQSAQPA